MNSSQELPFQILLADDDKDDRFFFRHALSQLSIKTQLTALEDGEQLITFLSKNSNKLPDVLFLDLNMPRKNGAECLAEIKSNKKLQLLPVIIYSTSLHESVADELYKSGAHYYVRKTDLDELTKVLQQVLTMMKENKFARPTRKKFVLSLIEA